MDCTLHKSQIEEIEIDLTGTCNLSCPLCTRNFVHAQHMVKKNIRPMKDIIAQLDSFNGLKRFFIAGAVSEPTLHPEFIAFIQYLNSRGITFELFTNGSTHDEAWWRELGTIVDTGSMCCFTVCGSTQELHEKYRVGSDLAKVLKNAHAFRCNGRCNDWCQHILFEYNREDLESGAMDKIFSQFSHKMLVGSEGIRRLDNKVVECQSGVRPTRERDEKIRFVFKHCAECRSDIMCKSFYEKKVYIDQFGRISACYRHPEFENDYFIGDTFDYSCILAGRYADCSLCSKQALDDIRRLDLEFIC